MERKTVTDFFDALAQDWDQGIDKSNPSIKLALDLIKPEPNLKIIDVGCGTGIMENFLAVFNPQKMLGIDISPKMIEYAHRNKKHPWADYVCADIMEFSGQKFTLCTVHNALPHFGNTEKLVKHLAGLLEDNGRIAVFHSQSRQKINKRHMEKANHVSCILPSGKKLANFLEKYFNTDIIVDNDHLYLVSGTKIKTP